MAILLERTQVGKREDLADLIAVADKRSTPLGSMIPKGKKPANTLFDWQVDKYRNPTTTPHVDGADVTPDTNQSADRTKVSGRVSFLIEDFGVSALAEDVSDVAGLGKKREFAQSAAKAMVVIKRAAEAIMCSDGDSQADNGSQGYQTRGLGKWIDNAAQADLEVPSGYRTPVGQIYSDDWDDFGEKELNDILEARYNSTGEIKTLTLLAGSQLKRKITGFANWDPHVATTVASLRTFNQDSKDRKIVNTVDIYQGDFGTVEIFPSTWLAHGEPDDTRQRRGYILDMSMLEVRYNTYPEMRELEDKGGGRRGFIRTVFGLVCKNPLSHCKIDPEAVT